MQHSSSNRLALCVLLLILGCRADEENGFTAKELEELVSSIEAVTDKVDALILEVREAKGGKTGKETPNGENTTGSQEPADDQKSTPGDFSSFQALETAASLLEEKRVALLGDELSSRSKARLQQIFALDGAGASFELLDSLAELKSLDEAVYGLAVNKLEEIITP